MSGRIFLSPPWMSGNELPLIEEAFASNYIAPCGPMVDRFESGFAQAVGLPDACALSSGTAALELLFHELGIGAGDTVFCSDLTFVASVAPAVRRGAVPVFIDCDAATWTMDPDLLDEALAEAARTGRLPKVVVAADLYGQCCDYERIEAACATYGVPLIIDAAEALGARYYGRGGATRTGFLPPGADGGYASKIQVRPAPPRPASVGGEEGGATRTGFLPPGADGGCASKIQVRPAPPRPASVGGEEGEAAADRANHANGEAEKDSATLGLSNFRTSHGRHAGDAGWAAVYSFNGNKIITTSGGGMVASRDGGVVARARKRAQQSREPVVWYEHQELGYNHRMSNIVAAIGVGQLMCLERIIGKKRQIFEWYRQRLGPSAGFMPEAAYGQCTRWLTVVQVSSEDLGVRSGVGSRETGVGRPSETVERLRLALEAEDIESRPVWKPMHLQPVFRGAEVYGGGCGERLFRSGLCLPSGAGLTEPDVARVCGIFARVLAQSGL